MPKGQYTRTEKMNTGKYTREKIILKKIRKKMVDKIEKGKEQKTPSE